jgi:hypothetical protein
MVDESSVINDIPSGFTLQKSDADGNCLYHSVISATTDKNLPPGGSDEFKNITDNNEKMTLLRGKLSSFLQSEEYKKCPLYVTHRDDEGSTKDQQQLKAMLETQVGITNKWSGESVISLIECMYKQNVNIQVFYKRDHKWVRSTEENDFDENKTIYLYFTGAHYDWLKKVN